MPSLNALGQFKYSFNNIAKEKEDIESLGLPFNDFDLPTTEAPPFQFIRHEAPAATDVPALDDMGLDDGGTNVDLNSFLNNLTGDEAPPAEAPPESAVDALDSFLKELGSPPPEPESDSTGDLSDLLSNMDMSTDAPADVPPTDDLSSFTDSMQDEAAPDVPADDDFSSFLGGQDEAAADIPADVLADTPANTLADEGAIPDDLLAGFSDQMESAPADEEIPDFGTEDFSAEEPAAPPTPPPEENEDDLGGIDLGGESIETAPAEPEDASADFGLDDFNVDSIGDAGGDTAGAGAESADAPDETFEMPDLNGIDLGGESPVAEQESAPVDSTPDSIDTPESWNIDLGGESPDITPPASDDFSSADLPDFNTDSSGDDASLSGTDFDISSSEADFSGADADVSFGGDADADLGTDFGADADAGLGADFGADTGADTADATTETAFDMGDLGSDFASDSIDIETGGAGETQEGDSSGGGFSDGGDIFGGDDFSLTGLDDILNKTKVSAPKPVEKKGLFGRKKRKEKEEEVIKAEDNIDEIALSQHDVDNLLHTLSTYPLNLRITCEELIAEQVILPEQLSKLVRLLVRGAGVRETADHVETITGTPIVIPKSFEKSSGAAFEAEQSSFAYIFVHNLLPVLRLIGFILVMLFSVLYLGYKFIWVPIEAESLYKRGYERIPAGEYQRANELFHDAFVKHRKKKWFYAYAEAFRDQRRYMLAENKYDELLRYYPRDKKGVLDYAALNTYYLMNYEKANKLLQRELLDYAPNDFDGLLAAGDNFLDWADSNPQKFYDHYEDARFSYARLIEQYGWLPPVIERMLKYFIRTDNLKETLQLRVWFENDPKKRKLSTPTLAELGGYLLDKQLQKTPGTVPDPYIESIESVRDMLLQAVMQDLYLPEPHYHLARYYHSLGNTHEERLTLENAIRAFDLAKQESVKRRLYRVDTHYRYANLLINNREFFPADEQAVRGIELFEDFMNRNLIPPSSQLGQLYAVRGDLEYFVKSGNMEAAINNYKKAELYSYAPPEVQYRMGAAYYQQEDWRNAIDYLFRASKELPLNRRLLFAMGNAAYQRGDYFAAKGYYDRLLDVLETQRVRLPVLLPNDNVQFLETGERLMMARNNAGVVNEALARQTGNRDYRSKAMVLYAESSRAWDAITRNPETMTRGKFTDSSGAPSINLGYLNANNALRPTSGYRPQIFTRIDKDALEPSRWEELAPMGGFGL
jgi:tetratricopeptide (TPR) repeat protein